MHPQWPILTIGGKVLKDSDDVVIWEVTFGSKMLFRSIFTQFPVQHLKDFVSWGSSGAFSMVGYSMGDAFRVLSGPFWSTVRQCISWRLIHSLNYWTVQSRVWCCFLSGVVIGCDVAHCQSVAVLCMLYKIGCHRMQVHPLYDALPGPCVPVWATSSALVTHLFTYDLPHCITSKYSRTIIPLSESL